MKTKSQRLAYLIGELAVPIIFMGYNAVYLLTMQRVKPIDLLMVRPLSILIFVLGALLCIKAVMDYRKESKSAPAEESGPKISLSEKLKRLAKDKKAQLAVLLTAYIALIGPLGFYISSLAFSVLLMALTGVRKKFVLIGVPVIILVVLYMIFDFWMGMNLPKLGLFGII
jgi:hypothetical protein